MILIMRAHHMCVRCGRCLAQARQACLVDPSSPLQCVPGKHAPQDMRRSGHTLAQILKAGQWRSAAFLDYLDQSGLEQDLVFATAIDEPMEWLN
jgi:hypothetical protein